VCARFDGPCQISNNAWLPFSLVLPSSLQIVRATNSSIQSIISSSDGPLSVVDLALSNNSLSLVDLSLFVQAARQLAFFSCENCSLQGELSVLTSALLRGQTSPLYELHLGSNDLGGVLIVLFDAYSLDPVNARLPSSIRHVDLDGNPRIVGALPTATTNYDQLQSFDCSGCSVIGSLPESWTNLVSLQQVDLRNTSLACSMTVDANGEVSRTQLLIACWMRRGTCPAGGCVCICSPHPTVFVLCSVLVRVAPVFALLALLSPAILAECLT
jgi:hypothetical protein